MRYGITAIVTFLVIIIGFYFYGRAYWYPYFLKLKGKRTLSDVIEKYGHAAERRFLGGFETANVPYPPGKLILFAIKAQDTVEVWALGREDDFKRIKAYKVKAASGVLGPKLREGDRQVPEGIYRIVGLNPNSAYHLSMKLNYPNEFDQRYAQKEGRENPGSNIFIHGKAASIGCLAMGDRAIEELFIMVHRVGESNVEVIISPTDPRTQKLIPPAGSPDWIFELYGLIEERTRLLMQ